MPDRAAQYRPTAKRLSPSEATRPNATDRGYGSRWKRFRAHFLRQHPLCERCEAEGRVEAACHAHHRDGKGTSGPAGFDPDNIEPLCERHHNAQSARDRHAKARG